MTDLTDSIFTKAAQRWVEELHPRDPAGKFAKRGFDVVRTDPIPEMATHIGKLPLPPSSFRNNSPPP